MNSVYKTNQKDENLLAYYKDMAKYKLLNKKQELFYGKLIKKAKIAKCSLRTHGNNTDSETKRRLERIIKRGEDAKFKLTVCNLRLVVKYAKNYAGQGLPLLDLIQEGNRGLFRAVEKYDYSAGNRFSTYATYWIKQSLSRAVQKHGKNICLPYHKAEDLLKIRRVENELKVDLCRKPNFDEIAKKTKFSADYVEQMLSLNVDTKSLLEQIDEYDENSRGLSEIIADKNAEDPIKVYEQKELAAEISSVLKKLNVQENKVIKLRFGLDDNEALTLEEIGNKLSISRERVRQIQNNALAKLRKSSNSARLFDYVAS